MHTVKKSAHHTTPVGLAVLLQSQTFRCGGLSLQGEIEMEKRERWKSFEAEKHLQ